MIGLGYGCICCVTDLKQASDGPEPADACPHHQYTPGVMFKSQGWDKTLLRQLPATVRVLQAVKCYVTAHSDCHMFFLQSYKGHQPMLLTRLDLTQMSSILVTGGGSSSRVQGSN